MANTIITKNSVTASAIPTSGQLVQGELAVNVTDKRLFTENSAGTVVEVGTNPSTIAVVGNVTVGGTLGVTGLSTLAAVNSGALAVTGAISATTTINGALNGTLGATTPAAVTATTVTASGSIIKVTGTNPKLALFATASSPQINFGNAAETVHWSIYETVPVGGAQAPLNVYDNVAAATRATFSSTGLAVTGAISANSAAATAPFIASINGGEKMRIDSAGNVGIGGTNTNNARLALVNNSSNNLSSELHFRQTYAPTVYSSILTNFGGTLALYADKGNAAPGTSNIIFSLSNSERMRINSAGNVGIGTSSPATKLHVSNDVSTAVSVSRTGALPTTIIVAADAGSTRIYSRDNATGAVPFRIQVGTQDRLTVETDGVLSLPFGQIKFPATQVASADANTLDDYEEGTFTPTVRGTTTVGTASYSGQNGSYVKVGRLVHFQLIVVWSSGTGTGDLEVGGLPFNTTNDSTFPAVTIGYANNLALTANTTPLALLRNSGNAIYFYQIPSGGGSNINIPYDGTASLIIAGTYKTNA